MLFLFVVQEWHLVSVLLYSYGTLYHSAVPASVKSHKPDLLVGLALFTTALYIKLHFVDRY